jgi:indolepyruvate ferredoxin oxidoreductase beta subunit
MTVMDQVKTVKILICAMGGEGGGVLMNWIVNAAWAKGYPVQATSVPGVAQRTGATTYYIEMLPQKLPPGAAKPIFALIPTAGEVDVLIATEAAEAARAAGNGLITPDRTHLIASTSRVYLMPEKMAMTDGRVDDKKLSIILHKSALKSVLFDANSAAKETGTVINAIMLGAVAAVGVIGIEFEDFVDAIKNEGKAVKSNIAGLSRGYAIAEGKSSDNMNGGKTEMFQETVVKNQFPESVQPILQHAIRRLIDFQHSDYAEIYLYRLKRFKNDEVEVLHTVAKQLALRMTYEDIIRVAQAKIRKERFERIKGEATVKSNDLLIITDFFKPGISEISDMLPSAVAKLLISWGKKNKKIENFSISMEVKTTTIIGFLKLWVLAKLRWWRPRSHRWKIEQANIEDWLDLVEAASQLDSGFANEVADLSRLIKGYGSTHKRGLTNFMRIVESFVKPILNSGRIPVNGAKNLRLAREAATQNPDGSDLDKILLESDFISIAAE